MTLTLVSPYPVLTAPPRLRLRWRDLWYWVTDVARAHWPLTRGTRIRLLEAENRRLRTDMDTAWANLRVLNTLIQDS